MNAQLLAKLTSLQNRHTRYEVVATNGSQRILAGYTARKGRIGILKTLRMHGQAWVDFTGSQSIDFAKRASDGATMGAWRINFSGRTQRDAYLGGELPFIADTTKLAA